MQVKKKVLISILALTVPFLVSADTLVTLTVPTHISPLDNTALTSANFNYVRWSPVTSTTTPLTYYFESSYSSGVTVDGKFASPFNASTLLGTTSVATPLLPDGTYYWHVRSADTFGNVSAWSTPWKVVIDSSAPTVPGIPVVVAVKPPIAGATPAPTTTLGITATTVAAHAIETDCWIIVSGKVYSVSSYISMHPGGRSAIVSLCGKDATTAFNTKGGSGSHSNSAKNTLGSYFVGNLGAEVTTTPATTSTTGVQIWNFASSTDLLSGVAYYEYSTDGGISWTNNGTSTSVRTTSGLGVVSLSIRAVDRVGNKSTFSGGFFTVEATSALPLPTASQIMPVPPVALPTSQPYLTNQSQCKKNGWKKFNSLKFKSEKKCADYVKQIDELAKKQKKAREAKEREAQKISKSSESRKNTSSREKEHDDERDKGGRGERD